MPRGRQINILIREMNVSEQKTEAFAILSDISNTLLDDNFYNTILKPAV